MEEVAGGASPKVIIVYVCVFVNPDIYYNFCVTLYVRYVKSSVMVMPISEK